MHKHLTEKNRWYATWHQNPYHTATHFLIFFIFIGLVGFSTLTSIAKSTKEPNEVAAAHRKGGLLPDDSEKIKKIPRVTVKDTSQQIQPAAGESLVVMSSLSSLPTSFSLETPTPQDQGGEGACSAFASATARTIEEHYKNPSVPYNIATNIFSPEYLYNQSKSVNGCGSGSSISGNLDIIANQGVATLQSMPYSDINNCNTLPNTEQLAEAAGFKINTTYTKILNTDQVTIKTLLASNRPLIAGLVADNSFINATPGFIWKTKTSGALGHAIVFIGYDDAKHAYKVINSWGTGWGDAGYGWIDYDLLPSVSAAYLYNISLNSSTDITPPTAVLTGLPNGTTLSGTVSLNATVSDDVAIAGVRFRVDGVTVGTEDTTAPYSVQWNTASAAPGTHTVTALARDTTGNLTASSAISVTVPTGDTVSPSVSTITAPAAGSTVSGPIITVSANAADTYGIAKVNFMKNGTIQTEDTESPFTVALRTVSETTTTDNWTADAYDRAGNKLQSLPVLFTTDYSLPIISDVKVTDITSTSATVQWTTDALSDSRVHLGTTTAYELSSSSVPTLVTSHSMPARMYYTLSPNTTYHYKVQSRREGSSYGTTSGDYTFTTLATSSDTVAPAISLTNPVDGATVSGTVTVSATATDNVGVTKVEFYTDSSTTPFAVDTAAPYSVSLNTATLAVGSHTITAVAYDSALNNARKTNTIIVAPSGDTTAPLVTITSPANGAKVSKAKFKISTLASDASGIANTKIFVDSTLVKTCTNVTTCSISYSPGSLAVGTHTISAIATDKSTNANIGTAYIQIVK